MVYTVLSVQLAHGVRDPRLHTYGVRRLCRAGTLRLRTYGVRYACGRGREFEDTEIGRHESPDNVDATTHSQARATARRQARMERETLGDTSMGKLPAARRH